MKKILIPIGIFILIYLGYVVYINMTTCLTCEPSITPLLEFQKDDRDKDGIVTEFDNCGDIYNPDQKDIDNSGYGDACEPIIR